MPSLIDRPALCDLDMYSNPLKPYISAGIQLKVDPAQLPESLFPMVDHGFKRVGEEGWGDGLIWSDLIKGQTGLVVVKKRAVCRKMGMVEGFTCRTVAWDLYWRNFIILGIVLGRYSHY